MNRRKFLSRGAAAAAGGGLAVSQAIAQTPSLPSIRWRCASSFPKSLDTIYGGAEVVAKRVEQLTGGKFQIRVFAAGEIVPAFGVVDAMQQGTIECSHTASYYFVGKNKTFAFDTTLPFGMNQREQNAWIYYGGGLDLVREFFKDFGFISFPAGNTGAQMGGWWRKEVQHGGGPEGREDAHRRPRRRSDGAPRRGAAADRRRRHLPGARARRDRLRRMGRPLRRREARLLQDRAALLLPRLVGVELDVLAST